MGLLKIVALITVINVRREEDAHAQHHWVDLKKNLLFLTASNFSENYKSLYYSENALKIS